MSTSFMGLAGIGRTKKKKHTGVGQIVEIDEMELFEPTAKKFPRFNLKELIVEKTGKAIGYDNPMEENEEFQKIQAIASRFEEKYGGKLDKNGRKIKFGKPEDYMDLGMGYDSNDSFIDDSTPYDELIPSNLEPIHGGYYVNTGKVQFKEISDTSEESSSDEEEDENSKDKEETKKKSSVIETSGSSSSSDEEGTNDASESSSTSDESSPDKDERMDVDLVVGRPPLGKPPTAIRSSMVSEHRKIGQAALSKRNTTMSPKRKATSNLLKKAKMGKRPSDSPKKPVKSADRSSSFYGRVSDVVASVVAAAGKPNSLSTVPEKTADQPPPISSTMVNKPTPSVAVVNVKPPQQQQERPKLGLASLAKRIDTGTATAMRKAVPESKLSKPATNRLDTSEIKEIDMDRSTSKQGASRPTGNTESTWKVPQDLQELNSRLVERAKESGQLSFSHRTDVVLLSIMDKCEQRRYTSEEIQLVLDDLSRKLRVGKGKILNRWDRIKHVPIKTVINPASNKPKPSIAMAGSTTATSTSSPTVVSKTSTSTGATVIDLTPPAPKPKVQEAINKSFDVMPANITKLPEKRRSSESSSISSTNIAELMAQFKAEIDRQMPALESEYRMFVDEAALKKLEQIKNPGQDKQKMLYAPRRKYSWSEASKNYLNTIVAKVMNHLVLDTSIADKEEALKTYFEKHVLQLFPSNWVNSRELMKESRDVYIRYLKDPSKPEPTNSPMVKSNQLTSVSQTSIMSPVKPSAVSNLQPQPTASTTAARTLGSSLAQSASSGSKPSPHAPVPIPPVGHSLKTIVQVSANASVKLSTSADQFVSPKPIGQSPSSINFPSKPITHSTASKPISKDQLISSTKPTSTTIGQNPSITSKPSPIPPPSTGVGKSTPPSQSALKLSTSPTVTTKSPSLYSSTTTSPKAHVSPAPIAKMTPQQQSILSLHEQHAQMAANAVKLGQSATAASTITPNKARVLSSDRGTSISSAIGTSSASSVNYSTAKSSTTYSSAQSSVPKSSSVSIPSSSSSSVSTASQQQQQQRFQFSIQNLTSPTSAPVSTTASMVTASSSIAPPPPIHWNAMNAQQQQQMQLHAEMEYMELLRAAQQAAQANQSGSPWYTQPRH